jgi:hypothetical protein
VRAELREIQRPERERLLRQDRGKPRNLQEWEIFTADLLKDEADGEGTA